MAAEIERKFVLDRPPDDLPEGEPIQQGYLAVVEGEREVRVRRRGQALTLTVKLGAGRDREEVEIDLEPEQFDLLWPLTQGMRVHKTRHEVSHGDLTIEIDIYGQSLDGMIVAEVEFDSELSSDSFEPPEWLGSEVTGDARYANESLAFRGRPPAGSGV